jgi:hypothetical protein
MKLSIPTKTDEANVAVTLIKSGRPWLGFSLVVVCRALWCLTVLAMAIIGIVYGLR